MAGHIVLFKHKDLRGHHRHIFDEEANLKHDEDNTLNDNVSSFVVLEGTWRLYRNVNFDVPYDGTFGPGIYRWVKDYGIENDDMSSLKCVSDGGVPLSAASHDDVCIPVVKSARLSVPRRKKVGVYVDGLYTTIDEDTLNWLIDIGFYVVVRPR